MQLRLIGQIYDTLQYCFLGSMWERRSDNDDVCSFKNIKLLPGMLSSYLCMISLMQTKLVFLIACCLIKQSDLEVIPSMEETRAKRGLLSCSSTIWMTRRNYCYWKMRSLMDFGAFNLSNIFSFICLIQKVSMTSIIFKD